MTLFGEGKQFYHIIRTACFPILGFNQQFISSVRYLYTKIWIILEVWIVGSTKSLGIEIIDAIVDSVRYRN